MCRRFMNVSFRFSSKTINFLFDLIREPFQEPSCSLHLDQLLEIEYFIMNYSSQTMGDIPLSLYNGGQKVEENPCSTFIKCHYISLTIQNMLNLIEI